MSIPIATTTIAVVRGADPSNTDPWDPVSPGTTVASGVRAVIDAPSGSEAGPGDTETILFTLFCDTADVKFSDSVRDEQTGETYRVVWAKHVPAPPGVGLDHVQAGLKQVSGFGDPQ